MVESIDKLIDDGTDLPSLISKVKAIAFKDAGPDERGLDERGYAPKSDDGLKGYECNMSTCHCATW